MAQFSRRRILGVLGSGLVSAGAGCISAPIGGSSEKDPTEKSDFGTDSIPYETRVSHELSDWERYEPDWTVPETAPPTEPYETELLAENLEIPWDMAFAPSGELFVTERTGRVLRIDEGQYEPVAEPDAVIDAEALPPGSQEDSWLVEGGEGGLLGIAIHPTYPEPPLVYTYFTTEKSGERINRVTAFDTSSDDSWVIVDDIPGATYHNGGRITFGPQNYLWIATGDGDPALDNPEQIADPGRLGGKILRVAPDGSVPADNPDIGQDADPRVFTYGHRNPQGISWLPDGTPVSTEHGPGGGDEVNILEPGGNYGWPEARHGDGFKPYSETSYQRPVAGAPSWAPSGSLFYTGESVPGLRNRLLVGGLISQQLIAVTISQDASRLADGHDTRHDGDWMDESHDAASTSLLTDRLGRIRHVEQGPDGGLYAVTSNRDGRAEGKFPTERDDKLVRIRPAE